MRRLRTFVAVELSGAVKSKARQLARSLGELDANISWAPAEQMHLTLKFLGEVPEVESPEICRTVAEAVAEFETFEIVFRGLGAFPSAENPRTLWLGVRDGSEELIELQAAVEDALHSRLGFAKDHRRFQPHLTLGRIKQVAEADAQLLTQLIHEHAEYDGDLTVVDEVVTFASYLRREGAEHQALDHAPLAN